MEQDVIGIGCSLICLVRNELEGTGKLGLVVKPPALAKESEKYGTHQSMHSPRRRNG
jgi:hypothetical protein